jgi:hypothetical protein
MKKIVVLLVGFAFVSMVFAVDKAQSVTTPTYYANNVAGYKLGNAAATSIDSIPTATCLIAGPFNMSISRDRTAFKGLTAYAPKSWCTANCSLEVSYQLSATGLFADTNATWVGVDTFPATGESGKYIDLSSKIGGYVFLRLKNITAATTAVILKQPRILFVAPSTDYVDTKN